jgi:uncharacterized membrane protein
MRSMNDEGLELKLANLLRIGVMAAATIAFLGGCIYLLRHGGQPLSYHTFHAGPAALRSPIGIIGDAMKLHGRGIIQLGVLVLIATPIARVLLSVFGFLRERDRLYVVVTFIVLAILVYSFVWGR